MLSVAVVHLFLAQSGNAISYSKHMLGAVGERCLGVYLEQVIPPPSCRRDINGMFVYSFPKPSNAV